MCSGFIRALSKQIKSATEVSTVETKQKVNS